MCSGCGRGHLRFCECPKFLQKAIPALTDVVTLIYRRTGCLQRLYGKIPRVRVPKIKWNGLTTRRVLTMEWIEGVKLTDTEAMARNNLQILDFVDVGIECSLRQLLAEDGGFFHADPHPGMLRES